MDLLERVTQEHEHFQADVDEFQLWLKAMVEKADSCVGRNCKLPPKQRLSALQVTPLCVHPGPAEGVLTCGGFCVRVYLTGWGWGATGDTNIHSLQTPWKEKHGM